MTPQEARAALRANAQRLREALEKATPGSPTTEFMAEGDARYYRVHGDGGRKLIAEMVVGEPNTLLIVLALNAARAAALAFETLADTPCSTCGTLYVEQCDYCDRVMRVAEVLCQDSCASI